MTYKEQHAEYMRKYRATVKALHICPRCGKKDSRTRSGRTYCEACAGKYREYHRRKEGVDDHYCGR